MRILMAEDDPMIASVLTQRLVEDAHVVEVVTDGKTALSYARLGDFDVVLLDLGLPGLDGIDVLHALRAGDEGDQGPVVIVITARGAVTDKVTGLDAGADDYLVKPFAYEELHARLRAVGRRCSSHTTAILRAGTIALDEARATACCSGGESVPLTRRELALLRALIRHPGVVLSRDQLESQVYGSDIEIESNAIDFIIRRLRGKLGGDCIRNVRGLGWMIPRAR
ncbi:response regulator transcription factor [Paeniglutamicibacter cryotolerans]|uniref:Two-component system OmpR family response regulator n=1 Tax=Paeniglutamicibacter cryotolerans TaxID=670079 RepID=A0A839QPP1_9MICC|nr:response regulator transcription factor [Paeniglutamicibacter cryotolerans]MBB2997573.1 two-component system OmpR family response regulator [Paeniglutamicibacter cryotolerans]